MATGKHRGRTASVRAASNRITAAAPPQSDPPAAPSATPARGFLPDGRLSDGTGRIYAQVTEAIEPGRAVELLAAGAAVVWDDCGCHGACGVEWVQGDRLDRLRRAGRPAVSRIAPKRKRAPSAWIEEWRAADGSVLLYVAGTVVWGTAAQRG